MSKNEIISSVLIAFSISVIISPIVIPFLKKLKFGQFVRDDGPESHIKKSGTPTMGGLIILISIVATSLMYIDDYPQIIPVLFCTLGFGIIGFLDDYIKVVMKRSMGLLPWQKFLGQLIIALIFAYYIKEYTNLGDSMYIPFVKQYVEIDKLYYPLIIFTMLGTANGANFTDGLDGLASSVTVLIAAFFSIVAIVNGSSVAPIGCATVGGLLGFLVYNIYPARVFMGDTGSLALGGFVASTAYVLKMPLIILLVAFIYFAEVLSVIIQVLYYKRTGKRFFKMAPIHHHLELCGWPETKVVAIFSIITAMLCMIGMLAI